MGGEVDEIIADLVQGPLLSITLLNANNYSVK